MFVLFETPAGYALFKAAKELRKASTDEVWKHFASADAAAASLKLKAFQPFSDTAAALSAATALVDGTLDETLTSFIRRQAEKAGSKLTLAIADAKIGAALTKALPIDAVCDKQIEEVMRGIRQHSSTLISGVTAEDTHAMQLGVAHSLCRYKLRFSPDKVDTMIIQAIALLDELDKELNSYAMRVREWYGWHFPEMGKIVMDNILYAKTVQSMRIRSNAHSCDLSAILADDVESAVKEAAEVSMGTEIADEDIDNISALCAQVISISEYRASLYDYLRDRMTAIAPNLTVMVGELVGARLIAHAGSLMSLAKQPASTVQILGAEKALFRALKTKCFPADDHQILTEHGFMTLADVLDHFDAHDTLGIACYVRGALEYHRIQRDKVTVAEGDHMLVRFEAAPVTVTDKNGRGTVRSNGVSLLVTDNHRMWVRMGQSISNRIWSPKQGQTQAQAAPPFRLVDAAAVVKAGTRDETTVVQMSGQFQRGLAAADPSVGAFELAQQLGLATDAQLDVFLELYGYWCGDGWLDGTKAAVSFGPIKTKDHTYLDRLFAQLDLPLLDSATRGARGYYRAPKARSNGQLVYHVVDPGWWTCFGAQYGHKYAGNHARAAVIAAASAGGYIEPASRPSNLIYAPSTPPRNVTKVQSVAPSSAAPSQPPDAEDIKSAKWFWYWVWRRSRNQMRKLIRGLAMADGDSAKALKSAGGTIYTSSVRFRDEIVRAMIHAGYSCTAAKRYDENTPGGINSSGVQMVSAVPAWKIQYSECTTVAQPKLTVANEVHADAQPWRGTVWCVTVPTAEHLIMARRIVAKEGDIATKLSRPVIVGNSETPKYGLIYHASLVGQAAPKMKGKVSRMLAAKAALSVRMDALGEQEGASIGLRAREQVELRLKQLEGGSAQSTSGNSRGIKHEQQQYQKPTNIKSYNTAADSTANISVKRESMNGNGQVKADVPATRPHSAITDHTTSSSSSEEPKKKKKKLIEVVEAAPVDDADDDTAASSTKKNKKRKAQTEVETATETITAAPSEKKKKKKKNNDDE